MDSRQKSDAKILMISFQDKLTLINRIRIGLKMFDVREDERTYRKDKTSRERLKD